MKIFETFECSGQNLSNSLCQFLNDKLIPPQIWHPSSVSWKITPLYFSSSNNIYFVQKEPIKMKTFDTFKCSGQNSSNSSCQFWNSSSQFLFKLCIILHCHDTFNSSVDFKLYFGLKYPIKISILRLSIALVKSCHIPHVIFQTTSQYFFKLCIILQCHER